jgi:hypothetical protein
LAAIVDVDDDDTTWSIEAEKSAPLADSQTVLAF